MAMVLAFARAGMSMVVAVDHGQWTCPPNHPKGNMNPYYHYPMDRSSERVHVAQTAHPPGLMTKQKPLVFDALLCLVMAPKSLPTCGTQKCDPHYGGVRRNASPPEFEVRRNASLGIWAFWVVWRVRRNASPILDLEQPCDFGRKSGYAEMRAPGKPPLNFWVGTQKCEPTRAHRCAEAPRKLRAPMHTKTKATTSRPQAKSGHLAIGHSEVGPKEAQETAPC